ncbi:unnamed protein product [Closterium sp. NIES-54]
MDFLDLSVFKGQRFQSSGTLDMKLFQKPMNRYLYLPFKSYHTRATKLGFIRSELQRFLLRSSSRPDFLNSRALFFARLRARGYPEKFLLPIFKSVLFSDRGGLLQRAFSLQDSPNRGPLVLKLLLNPLVDRSRLGVSATRESLKQYLYVYTERAWLSACAACVSSLVPPLTCLLSFVFHLPLSNPLLCSSSLPPQHTHCTAPYADSIYAAVIRMTRLPDFPCAPAAACSSRAAAAAGAGGAAGKPVLTGLAFKFTIYSPINPGPSTGPATP